MSQRISEHKERFTIRASEVDQRGQVTLTAISQLFQEVAGNHALKLNFDISQLHEQNLTWVLHRMDIQMQRFPKWRQTITIETWPAAGDALRAYRDYRIMDEDGNEMGCCLSYWMMINLKSRRPTRMPQEVLELRLADREHVLPVKNDRLKPFEPEGKGVEILVRTSDLDMNEHVNNARYVEWVMEALSVESQQEIRHLDIMFLQETGAGTRIMSQKMTGEEAHHLHQLKDQDGTILALAESY